MADQQFRSDIARGVADVANRGAAAVLGGPVDLAALAMRPLGYRHSAPVGGSEWIGQQMEQARIVTPTRRPAAEILASLTVPVGGAKAAQGLARYALDAPAVAGSAGSRGLSAAAQLGAISPEGKARLLTDLQAGQGSGTYRLGDVTQGQLNALQRLGMPPAASRDVMMTDGALNHLLDARMSRDGFAPDDVVRFAKQAMEPRSGIVRDPAASSHKAALANDGLLDASTKKRYTAQMPLQSVDGQMQVVSVVPRGLPGRKTKAPE